MNDIELNKVINRTDKQQLSKEDVFDAIKEYPASLRNLQGMIDTVSSFGGNAYLSAATPTKFNDQIRIYVNTTTASAVSAVALYFYSNQLNKWISATGGVVG